MFIGTIITLYFVPWPIVKAWIAPLPKSVREVKPKDSIRPIEIEVTENQSVLLNGAVIEIDSIGPLVVKLMSDYPESEKAKITIDLTVNKMLKQELYQMLNTNLEKLMH